MIGSDNRRRTIAAGLVSALKRHREFWSQRQPPPRFARIDVVLDDEIVTASFRISATKVDRLREPCAGQSDDQIFDPLADGLFTRYGIRVA